MSQRETKAQPRASTCAFVCLASRYLVSSYTQNASGSRLLSRLRCHALVSRSFEEWLYVMSSGLAPRASCASLSLSLSIYIYIYNMYIYIYIYIYIGPFNVCDAKCQSASIPPLALSNTCQLPTWSRRPASEQTSKLHNFHPRVLLPGIGI